VEEHPGYVGVVLLELLKVLIGEFVLLPLIVREDELIHLLGQLPRLLLGEDVLLLDLHVLLGTAHEGGYEFYDVSLVMLLGEVESCLPNGVLVVGFASILLVYRMGIRIPPSRVYTYLRVPLWLRRIMQSNYVDYQHG
jgi:hypothetical protein